MSCAGAVCISMIALAAPDFRDVVDGIAHAPFTATKGFSGHLFKIDLSRIAVSLIAAGTEGQRSKLESMLPNGGDLLAANGSFFDRDGSAMGLAVSDGEAHHSKIIDRWPALLVENGMAEIVMGSELRRRKRPFFVIQGLPRLVHNGVVLGLKPQRAERTAVCAEGKTLTLITSTPAFSTEFAEYLAASSEQGGLGCLNAMNLDGGPSTQLVARLGAFSLRIPGLNSVPNALVFRPLAKR